MLLLLDVVKIYLMKINLNFIFQQLQIDLKMYLLYMEINHPYIELVELRRKAQKKI